MKKAFTLIEMLIVVGILGILMAVLISSFDGSVDKARTVKCATNLKNLHSAASSYAMGKNGWYPAAQHLPGYSGSRGYSFRFGWLGSLDTVGGELKSSPTATQPCSFDSENEGDKRHCLTNGVIWRYTGNNRAVYMCPAFAEACKNAGIKEPGWSYQMNARFGHIKNPGWFYTDIPPLKKQNSLERPDKTLMFAEIPTSTDGVQAGEKGLNDAKKGNSMPTGEAGDGCLKTASYGGMSEAIGFNHRRAKQTIGHVVFADGHVEAVVAPKNAGQVVELTEWLCRGEDIIMDGTGNYKSILDSIEEEQDAARND